MKKSEILKRVKRHLWDGNYRKHWSYPDNGLKGNKFKYLCHAITTISQSESSSYKTRINCDILIDFIRSILDRQETYEIWLHKYHRTTYIRMDRNDIQEGRKQWIEWMIQHFESTGE